MLQGLGSCVLVAGLISSSSNFSPECDTSQDFSVFFKQQKVKQKCKPIMV